MRLGQWLRQLDDVALERLRRWTLGGGRAGAAFSAYERWLGGPDHPHDGFRAEMANGLRRYLCRPRGAIMSWKTSVPAGLIFAPLSLGIGLSLAGFEGLTRGGSGLTWSESLAAIGGGLVPLTWLVLFLMRPVSRDQRHPDELG